MLKFVLALLLIAPTATAAPWKRVTEKSGVTLHARARAGSPVKEYRAVGTIKAPPWVCKNVIDDVAGYKEFMPHIAESTVVRREAGAVVSYQRIQPPLISDRDYTVRIRDLSFRRPDGTVVYKNAWEPANQLGPKPKDGVVRVTSNEGYWLLEPEDGGKTTRATYYLFTDPGGALPTFIINRAKTQTIPALFEAVRKQARLSRYRQSRPPLPGEVSAKPAARPPPASATKPPAAPSAR